ncbi:uncharacterized protein K02A2.6-like [Dendronephthya gigantea]|uniref:uncharacterized protein K02A2.6-like n=1 Tax=Dendronephthya gigantea TaxID=151771 RepID=UPI00106A199C|nr:uncharacterized protein K02A2.6-like [Dendronephthya gigantea]
MCRSVPKQNEMSNRRVRGIAAHSNDDFVIEAVYGEENNVGKDKEALAVVNIWDGNVRVKLDTGAEVNVMPDRVYQQLVEKNDGTKSVQLKNTAIKLTGYGGAEIPVKGTCILPCTYKTQQIMSKFFVVETNYRTVLSLETCKQLNLIRVMHSLVVDNLVSGCSTEQIKENYSKVFHGLGKLEECYQMQLDPKAVPVAQAPRKIPATLRVKLKQELDQMEEEQVIVKVDEPTDWVHNPVIVEKPNGKFRVCLDPRELNKYLKREQYQLPMWEEISSRLYGARFFSTLDANQGYWQISLDHESSRLTTFNTPFGRYRFLRMPFGIHSAQEVFHKRVNRLYEDLEGVETDIDDILVWGRTIEEHDQRLQAALDRTKSIGMTLNPDKCTFRVTEVTYFGHKLTAEGIRPDQTKIEAIINMPAPQDKAGVQRLLGMVNYLAKFIPEMSEITAPLRELLKINVPWHWTTKHATAFQKIKEILSTDRVLRYYDVTKPVVLQTDASKKGLGAVLLQDGFPVAYASRTMTTTQERYAQIEKELLAVVFACERFHQYIYGKTVEVHSDHKPLESILKKPLGAAPARLQRMLLRLQKYDINLIYKQGKLLKVADTLSRAQLAETAEEISEQEMKSQVHLIYANLPCSSRIIEEMRHETARDPVLQKVIQLHRVGWPQSKKDLPKDLKEYWNHKLELNENQGIILKDQKIVVPLALRRKILEKLHQGHQGIEKTKQRVRQTVFWPRINNDIEDLVSKCSYCQELRNANPKEPMKPHVVPQYPWQVVGTDIFHWQDKDYLLVVDYYSRYWEVVKLTNMKAEYVITELRKIFSRHGIPEEIMSDNGPQYASREFQEFANAWDFKHVTSSPGYPRRNGLAERTVQTDNF